MDLEKFRKWARGRKALEVNQAIQKAHKIGKVKMSDFPMIWKIWEEENRDPETNDRLKQMDKLF